MTRVQALRAIMGRRRAVDSAVRRGLRVDILVFGGGVLWLGEFLVLLLLVLEWRWISFRGRDGWVGRMIKGR